jgi:hypothetical protein
MEEVRYSSYLSHLLFVYDVNFSRLGIIRDNVKYKETLKL